MISTPEKDFSSNKSLSAVTRNSQRYATAAPRIRLSPWSRKGDQISPTSHRLSPFLVPGFLINSRVPSYASVAPRVAASLKTMTVQNLSAQPPFITKDGSTIRSIETRSLPTSLAATHRGFAFCVAFPKAPFSIARMRRSKTKVSRKRASPQEAEQSGTITRSQRSFISSSKARAR